MKIKIIVKFICLFFVSAFSAFAQNNDVIFTVDNTPVYATEFIRVYNKNLDLVKEESQKDIDGYLKLFIEYKLKLQEAKALNLDKKPSYQREFKSYKKQLSKNYLSDSKVTNTLVEEAYNRLGYEINASHVLVRIDQNASAKDTLAAYNEILKLRERVLSEGYKKVQSDVHNGKTIFAEDLGYFSAFKMVYPFENAAYNTKVGEVSMPFRTQFGYHVVKVLDKRKSQGEVTVAHIMIKDDEEKIKEIYKRLEQGEQFSALAKQFSEDKSSASKGGELNPFSGGQLSSSEFEKQAFKLENSGDISKPFKSQFGWHIVKLINKKPLQPFNEIKAELTNKIRRDSRSKLIDDSRINSLLSKYNVTKNPNALSYFKSILNKNYTIGRWSIPKDIKAKDTMFTIQGKAFSYNDFAQYLLKTQRRNINKPLDIALNTSYTSYLNSELFRYQEENLINENQEFAQIVEEYRDGLLLFDLMETQIWNAAKKDSLQIKTYYEDNKEQYYYKERVDAIVASSAKKSDIKKVAKLLNKNNSIETIKSQINTNNKINVSFTSGILAKNHQALPKGLKIKKGVSKIFTHNNSYVVALIKNILPKTLQTFDEAKGKVISDYQIKKEKDWLKTLASKYEVKINKDILNTVKNQIKNQ
ncbi:peptidylprolyl isomerase [Lacinutrix sp. MedPE-SW]|uniref:peptidylprolyl isomerase n=1 Tax=Lacinutrix sp. MedPE-SW TaxID=1860087 RepID=UPI0009117D0C|nr:peptidylprolyl isomerase [Lacinutrix sp. MedPE-SW]OIQ22673.1 MAG: peptidylprolyl isomerase [Lacinutrix sp. MedPE-SW]